jgi:hypothetical protein
MTKLAPEWPRRPNLVDDKKGGLETRPYASAVIPAFAPAVILAKARIQIAGGNQPSSSQEFLDSILRWNDDGMTERYPAAAEITAPPTT